MPWNPDTRRFRNFMGFHRNLDLLRTAVPKDSHGRQRGGQLLGLFGDSCGGDFTHAHASDAVLSADYADGPRALFFFFCRGCWRPWEGLSLARAWAFHASRRCGMAYCAAAAGMIFQPRGSSGMVLAGRCFCRPGPQSKTPRNGNGCVGSRIGPRLWIDLTRACLRALISDRHGDPKIAGLCRTPGTEDPALAG